MAWAHAKDLAPHGATSVSITPGWLRSEMMLEAFCVTEENWRDASAAFRDLRDPPLHRARGCGACGRPGPFALERAIAFQRRAGEGLWLYRCRRLPPRRLAVRAGSPGCGKARRRHRLSIGFASTSGEAVSTSPAIGPRSASPPSHVRAATIPGLALPPLPVLSLDQVLADPHRSGRCRGQGSATGPFFGREQAVPRDNLSLSGRGLCTYLKA